MRHSLHHYLFCALLLLSGCVESMTAQTRQEPIHPPAVIPLNETELTQDMKLVLSAIIEQMRGSGQTVPRVSFASSGVHSIEDLEFHYKGFGLVGMGVTSYTTAVPQANLGVAKLEAILVFRDIIDRSATVLVTTEYTVNRNGILITSSAVIQLPPVAPEVETYFVPADRLKAAKDRLTTYTDYYLFALDKGAPMTIEGSRGTTRPKDDYIIMSFCKARLLPVSTLEMRVTANRNVRGQEVTEPAYIYDQGWRIMLAGGEFQPGSAANRFYINVEYLASPGSGAEPLLLATFENKKLPAPTAGSGQRPAATTATTVPQPSAEGPLGSGAVFLDLTNPADVMVIQQRFKELGLYTSAVDGAIGPGTRKAFDVFADQHRLQRGLWTVEMQQLLFQGTGR